MLWRKQTTKEAEKIKPISEAQKWSIQVFAGVASSQNYNNKKALGNVVDSKQSKAYGVKTNYKLSNKWALGSGLKVSELGQSIADVSYLDTQNSLGLTTTDFFIQNPNVEHISSNTDYLFVSNNARNVLNSTNFQNGSIDQRLKYIEMPLEVLYVILNKNKTNISLNTGGFVGKLISNGVFLNGKSIGENLGVNDFVYGSSLSSTVQYRLYKQTHVLSNRE